MSATRTSDMSKNSSTHGAVAIAATGKAVSVLQKLPLANCSVNNSPAIMLYRFNDQQKLQEVGCSRKPWISLAGIRGKVLCWPALHVRLVNYCTQKIHHTNYNGRVTLDHRLLIAFTDYVSVGCTCPAFDDWSSSLLRL